MRPSATLTTAAWWSLPLALASAANKKVVVSATSLPEPTGPFTTGVQDLEFTDTYYPSEFAADADKGRRIMFRVWYPACERSNLVTTISRDSAATSRSAAWCKSSLTSQVNLGRRRHYMESGEWEAYFGEPEPVEVTQTIDLTHSYLNAPPLDYHHHFPAIVYAHGFGMWMSDNTALLEEIASHGYAVFAISSPGFTSGTLYPNSNPNVVPQEHYPEIEAVLVQNSTVAHPLLAPTSPNLRVRHDKMELYLQKGGIPSIFPRLRDDMLALTDHLEEQTTLSTADDNKHSLLLQQLLGKGTGLEKVLYMGYSLGGAAAGSAAQHDIRAVGAINMDGLHQSMDLFGTPARIPYLTFAQNVGLVPFYYNEFFFEPLDSMGTNNTITRIRMPSGIGHSEFSDVKLLDQTLRESLLGITSSVDGEGLHKIQTSFCLGFIDTYLGDKAGWTPDKSLGEFPEIESIDVSYVADWATSPRKLVRGSLRGHGSG